MDRVEADGGDEATEADDEHRAHEPRVGVRRDAAKVGQAHEVAEDVPAGRTFASVGAGLARRQAGGGKRLGGTGFRPRARRAPGGGGGGRLLPAAARRERRHKEPGAQEEVGRVGAEERSVGELRTRPHGIVSITSRPASPLGMGTAGEAQREEGVHARCAAPGRPLQAS